MNESIVALRSKKHGDGTGIRSQKVLHNYPNLMRPIQMLGSFTSLT